MELRCYHPPVLFLNSADISAFFQAASANLRFVLEANKKVSDDFDDFPFFKRSYRARNTVLSGSVVSFSLSLSSI